MGRVEKERCIMVLFSAGGVAGAHARPFLNQMSPAGGAFQKRNEQFYLKFKIAWARSDSKACSAIPAREIMHG